MLDFIYMTSYYSTYVLIAGQGMLPQYINRSTTLKSKHKTHMFTFYQNRHDFRLQSIYVKESLSYHFVLCNIDMIVCLFYKTPIY